MALFKLIAVLTVTAFCLTQSDEIPCHSSLMQCVNPLDDVKEVQTYNMPQGMHRPAGNRSYEDANYTPNYIPQFERPWTNDNTLKWLIHGRGQLTDGMCGTRLYHDPEDQHPWVGWSTRLVNNNAQPYAVPLYFAFDSPVSLSSLQISTLNSRANAIALLTRIQISVSNDDTQPYHSKLWVSQLNAAAPDSAYLNTSQALDVTFTLPATAPLGRFVKLDVFANDSVFHWIMLSEITFCVRNFSRSSALVDGPSAVEMVEGEEGVISCSGSSIDSLQLVRDRDGFVFGNRTAGLPRALSVAHAVMKATVDDTSGTYTCIGNNSMAGTSEHMRITVTVLRAVDIFRPTDIAVPRGSSVLLKCCFNDNRRATVVSPLLWEWREITQARPFVRDSPLNYIIIDNVQPGSLSAPLKYECRVRLGEMYRDYDNVVSVVVTDGAAVNNGLYSNQLQNDRCDAPTPATVTSGISAGPAATRIVASSEITSQVVTTTSGAATAVAAGGDSSFGAQSVVLLIFLIIALVCLLMVTILLWKKRNGSYSLQRLRPRKHPHRLSAGNLPVPNVKTQHANSHVDMARDFTPPPVSLSPSLPGRSNSTSPVPSYISKTVTHTAVETEVYAQPDLTQHSLRKNRSATGGSTQLPPPYGMTSIESLPTPVGKSNGVNPVVYDTVQEPEQLQIYANPGQYTVHSNWMPRLADNNIYEAASDLEKVPVGETPPAGVMTIKQKRLTRLVALYEEPPLLAREEGPPLFDPDKIEYEEADKLGEGQFGDVYRARLLAGGAEPSKVVAIKTLKTVDDKDLRKSFEKEVKFMSRLDHNHVVKLLGICDKKGLTAMVMENMDNGDLHSFLLKRTLLLPNGAMTSPPADSDITLSRLVRMMQNVASGMEYLASNAYVHRDLAARNCLVAGDLTIKLGDFGLSCHLYERLYYRVVGKAVLPLQWMAPESFFGQFSVKSDVFSFGIACWEMLTMCLEVPFGDVEPKDLISMTVRARKEHTERATPEIPAHCPESVKILVEECWVMDPDKRPTFSTLNEEFLKISALMPIPDRKGQ